MNKQQKRELVNKRRFHQRVCKLANKASYIEIDMEMSGATSLNEAPLTHITVVDKKVVTRLTDKELEHILARRRDFNTKLIEVCSNEYVERKLLRERIED